MPGLTQNQTPIFLVGNLTDDPELRFTQNGSARTTFSVAVTERVKDGDTWKDGDATFWNITVWGDMAEHVAETLQKGQRAIVIGTIKIRRWQTPEGEPRSRPEITAEAVGPDLRWATAKVERKGRSNGQRAEQTAPSRSGQFRDEAPF
jgi:single-strand DNA-binding protein